MQDRCDGEHRIASETNTWRARKTHGLDIVGVANCSICVCCSVLLLEADSIPYRHRWPLHLFSEICAWPTQTRDSLGHRKRRYTRSTYPIIDSQQIRKTLHSTGVADYQTDTAT